ncbi:MAG: DHH family phosphoesterase [Lachnospiraceae bacterium]
MEKRPNDTIKMLRAEFANVRKTAIVGHLHPDGDCISSCLALYHYLKDIMVMRQMCT